MRNRYSFLSLRPLVLLLCVCCSLGLSAWEREVVWPKGKKPDAQGHCFQRTASPGTGSYTWLDRIGDFLRYVLKE